MLWVTKQINNVILAKFSYFGTFGAAKGIFFTAIVLKFSGSMDITLINHNVGDLSSVTQAKNILQLYSQGVLRLGVANRLGFCD